MTFKGPWLAQLFYDSVIFLTSLGKVCKLRGLLVLFPGLKRMSWEALHH